MSTLTESHTPVERVRSSEYMSLKILEGRGVATTGRPIRARRVPVKYRCRVMPVIDDDGTVIPVYVQEDGTVTKDIPQNADNDVLDDDDEDCDSDDVRAVFDDSDDIEDELTESEREEEAYWERQERIEKANKSKKRKRDVDSDYTLDENEETDEEEYNDDDEPEEENSEPATEPESEDEQDLEDYYEKGAREWKPPSTKRRKK